MNILVACEYSGIVRDAFIAKGHDAISCDLLPSELQGPHYLGDVRDILFDRKWDMLIAFPPCTDLAVSGARYFKDKKNNGRQGLAIGFFMMFALSRIPKICIENPVGIMNTIWRKPDQIIQPYNFGHFESKKTCLWLLGLPVLLETEPCVKPQKGYWDNQTPSGQNKLVPSPTRAKERSRTYLGIAKAMAQQWG